MRLRELRQEKFRAWTTIAAALGDTTEQDRAWFHSYCTASAGIQRRGEARRFYAAVLASFPIALLTITAPVYLLWKYEATNSKGVSISMAFPTVVLGITTLILFFLEHYKTALTLILGAVAVPVAMFQESNGDFRFRPRMPLPDAIPAGVATAGLGLLFSMVVPTFVVIRSVDLYSERQRARSAPEEIVFSGLRYAISRLSDGASFHHREFRSQIARRIHESATILELRGSAMVSVGDAGRVRTVETRMKEAAAVLHSYEVWLALPEFATRDVLLQELSRFIVTFCGGHFGELPRATLPPTPSHPSQAAVGRTVRTLITALMPAALLFLFTQLGLHPLAPMWNVMIAGSLLWAIVNLMALLDPGYTTKIATIKDLASIAQTFLRSAGKDSTGEDHSE